MGETGDARRYEPSARVRAQLEGLPALDSTDFWRRVEIGDKSSPEWLDSEVLVWALRQFMYRLDDAQSARKLGKVLLERWGKFVVSHAWSWFPTSEDDRQDFRSEVAVRLWGKVVDPAEEFWEANFIHALRCVCVDALRHLTRKNKRECPLPEGRDEDGEPLDELPDIPDPNAIDPNNGLVLAEEKEWLSRALPQLPLRIRQAIYLRYFEECPTVSKDPNVVTISGALGVSDRMVRYYLERGEALLRELYRKERGDGRASGDE